jgi:hypothetical protein
MYYSETFGGNNGNDFSFVGKVGPKYPKSITLYCGERVDGIQLSYSNGIQSAGNDKGTPKQYTFKANEYLNYLKACKDTFSDGLFSHREQLVYIILKTNKSTQLTCGKPSSDCTELWPSDRYAIAGFYGKKGWEIDRIGCIYHIFYYTCDQLKEGQFCNYDQTKILTKMPDGFFLNDTVKKTVDKCYFSCKNCTNYGNENNHNCDLCISNYYKKIDNSINCFNGLVEKYFLFDNYYQNCYFSCNYCYGFGNERNHNCSECISNYEFIDEPDFELNCYENCSNYKFNRKTYKFECSDQEYCLIRETLDKNKNEKEKKYCSNMHLLENKTTKNKKWQKSHGKNLIMNRLELKTDIFKNKSNINILSSFKNKSKNHSKKKKGINSVRPLIRNTTNTKNKKTEENIKTHMKEINNSLDNKDINKETILNTINDNSDFEDENETDVNNKYDFIIPEKYKNNKGELVNTMDTDGKIINIYSSNKKQIIFKSGVIKEIYPDGYQLVYFPNGDMKQKFVGEEEKIIYYYSETNTVQTTFKNGLNVFKFSNGQIEKHYNDGSKFIIYTNGMRKRITKSGKEKLIMPEKQNQQEDNTKNDKEIELNKEKHNNNFISENQKEDKSINKKRKFNENNNLLLSFLNIEKE